VRAIRRERYGIDRILVSLLAFCSFDHDARLRVPDAHALVQAACRYEAAIGRYRDGGDAVFDGEGKDALVLLDVPEPDRAVAGAGGDVAAVGGEVEGVDVLVVAGEAVADGFCCDVPDLIPHPSACGTRTSICV